MVRALPCHGRGYGFEPRHSRHFFIAIIHNSQCLNLSKGSASQDIRYLLELGAVQIAAVNNRRLHYEAVVELLIIP